MSVFSVPIEVSDLEQRRVERVNCSSFFPFRNAIRAGLDVLAPLYAATTEVGKKFDELREKEGLGAALRWRAAQFTE